MSSTDTQVGSAAVILAAVRAQTVAVNTFKNEQIAIYTTTAPTATVTDADGNPVIVPTWNAVSAAIAAAQAATIAANAAVAGSGLVEWNGLASEVSVPFTFASALSLVPPNFGYTNASNTVNATLSPDGTTFDALGSLATTSDIVIGRTSTGFLPKTGKLWFTIDIATANLGVKPHGKIEFTLVQKNNPAGNGADLTMAIVIIDPVDNVISVNYNTSTGMQSVAGVALLAGNQTLLFTVDLVAGTFAAYNAGQLFNVTMNNFTGSGTYYDTYMDCVIDANDVDVSGLFNTSNAAKSPYTIPSGYVAATMREAVPPKTPANGTLLRSTTTSIFDGVYLNGIDVYIYDDLGLIPIYSPTELASLNEPNSFSQPQQIQSLYYGSDAYTNLLIGALGVGIPSSTSSGNTLIGGGLGALAFGSNNVSVAGAFGSLVTGAGNVGIGLSVISGYNLNSSIILGTTSLINASKPAAPATNANVIGLVAVGISVLSGATIATVTDGGGNQSTTTSFDVFIGYEAGMSTLINSTTNVGVGSANVVIGNSAAKAATLVTGNVAIGANAMGKYIDKFGNSVAIGANALYNVTTSVSAIVNQNIAIGSSAGSNAVIGDNNVIVGANAALNSVLGNENIILGKESMGLSTVAATTSIAIGSNAMASIQGAMIDCIAIGNGANTNVGVGVGVTNAIAIGAQSVVTGSNQLQLGNSNTTVYAYGAVQIRSDGRDKADIRNTVLGLNFINQLRPVDWHWDIREDYMDYANQPKRPAPLRAEPISPTVAKEDPAYRSAMAEYHAARSQWLNEKAVYDQAMQFYTLQLSKWHQINDVDTIVPDGRHKRQRWHHGVIAQEVQKILDSLGMDFGGLQHHVQNGGKDVMTVGYEEFIGPLIRSVQEIDTFVRSSDFIDKLIERVVARLENSPGFIDKIATKVKSSLTS